MHLAVLKCCWSWFLCRFCWASEPSNDLLSKQLTSNSFHDTRIQKCYVQVSEQVFCLYTSSFVYALKAYNTTQNNIEPTAKECLEFTLQTDNIFIGQGYLLADNHCLVQPFCFLYKEVKPLFCIEASLYVGKINSTTISGAVACCSLLQLLCGSLLGLLFMLIVGMPPIITFFAHGPLVDCTVGQMTWCK